MPTGRPATSWFRSLVAALVLAIGATAVLAQPRQVDREGLESALSRELGAVRRIARGAGVHVVDVASGETVVEHGLDRSLVPASNQKLATTAAALDRLGPGYQFETRLEYRGVLHDGILVGDLAVVAGGDPNLSARWFDEDHRLFRDWANAVADAGISRITGGLILALDGFEPLAVHPDWPTDQLDRCYESPVTGLDYSDNCLVVRMWPGPAVGQSALVEVEPPDFPGRIDNQLVTSSRGSSRASFDFEEDGTLTIEGRIRSFPVVRYLAVPRPNDHFAGAFRHALDVRGVRLDGPTELVLQRAPGLWRPVHSHRTDLVTAIGNTNKRSHNFSAESILKTLGLERCGSGSWWAGSEVVRRFLTATVGLAPEGLSIADGSGMSRENRLTARHLTSLLRFMLEHRHGAAFVSSLPFAGEPSTSLEERLTEPPYRDNVAAKTGSLTGVSSLSGYAKGASGRLYAFAILMNGGQVWRSRQAQDDLVRALVDNG